MIDNHCIHCVIYNTKYECKECYKRLKNNEKVNKKTKQI